MKLNKKLRSLWNIISGRSTDIPLPEAYGWEGNDKYLVDFRPDRFQGGVTPGDVTTDSNEGGDTRQKTQTIKVAVKPKDILQELGRIPTRWSLEALDEKIAILKSKLKLMSQHYAVQEVEGLIQCLENRKKYDSKSKSGGIYRDFFSRFDATDHQKIDAFLKKHELVMKTADIFVPELPAVAAKTMTEYQKKVVELSSKQPRFFVIANQDQFKEAYGKRDPILLAQSPFGFYYYILGAWDEEMLNLAEL